MGQNPLDRFRVRPAIGATGPAFSQLADNLGLAMGRYSRSLTSLDLHMCETPRYCRERDARLLEADHVPLFALQKMVLALSFPRPHTNQFSGLLSHRLKSVQYARDKEIADLHDTRSRTHVG